MDASTFLNEVLIPCAEFIFSVDPRLDSQEARLQMMATAGYESNWTFKAQLGSPIALGYWMNQENAVSLLLNNPTSADILRLVASRLGLMADAATLHQASKDNELVGYTIARLLAFCDPHPLPPIGDEEACWQAYLRAQNPGVKNKTRWTVVYAIAAALFRPTV